MTVKQLIRELRHPPAERIAQVRIEFADGSVFEISPDIPVVLLSTEKPKKGERQRTKGKLPCGGQ